MYIRGLSLTAHKVHPWQPNLIIPKYHGIVITPVEFDGVVTTQVDEKVFLVSYLNGIQ